MLDIHRLLEDPMYKKYLLTTPRLPRVSTQTDPWYVYVQLESHGPWRRTSRPTYKESMRLLKRLLPDHHDIVIVSRRVAFGPPGRVVKVTRRGVPVMVDTPSGKVQKTAIVPWTGKALLDLEGGDRPHEWCPYCRRPTEFRYFPKHHAFRNAVAYDMTKLRCTVCGASQDLARNGVTR